MKAMLAVLMLIACSCVFAGEPLHFADHPIDAKKQPQTPAGAAGVYDNWGYMVAVYPAPKGFKGYKDKKGSALIFTDTVEQNNVSYRFMDLCSHKAYVLPLSTKVTLVSQAPQGLEMTVGEIKENACEAAQETNANR